MSLLEDTNTGQPTEAELAAQEIRTIPASMATELLFKWNAGWDHLWSASDPAAVLAALGTDAEEVFTLNEEIVTFLNSILTGRRQADLDAVNAKVAAKPATTTHPDGTVTLSLSS